jgi:hypothetical protein
MRRVEKPAGQPAEPSSDINTHQPIPPPPPPSPPLPFTSLHFAERVVTRGDRGVDLGRRAGGWRPPLTVVDGALARCLWRGLLGGPVVSSTQLRDGPACW